MRHRSANCVMPVYRLIRIVCRIMHVSESERRIRDNCSDMVSARITNALFLFPSINDH
jgi:hypothetical protein